MKISRHLEDSRDLFNKVRKKQDFWSWVFQKKDFLARVKNGTLWWSLWGGDFDESWWRWWWWCCFVSVSILLLISSSPMCFGHKQKQRHTPLPPKKIYLYIKTPDRPPLAAVMLIIIWGSLPCAYYRHLGVRRARRNIGILNRICHHFSSRVPSSSPRQ